jgi:hypothetical protein
MRRLSVRLSIGITPVSHRLVNTFRLSSFLRLWSGFYATETGVVIELSKSIYVHQCLVQRLSNCEARPPGGSPLVVSGAPVVCVRDKLILTKYGRKIKYIFW